MSRLRQNVQPKLRISGTQKKVLVISGLLVSTLAVLLTIFWSSVGSLGQASAFGGNNDSIAGYERPVYWGIDSVSSTEVKDAIDVKIWAKMNIYLVVRVLGAKDEVMLKKFIKVDKGSHFHRLDDIADLPSGTYTLEVSGEDKSERQSIRKE